MQHSGLHRIEVAFTREEWQSFCAVAELRKMTLSDFVREGLRLAPIEAHGRAVRGRSAGGEGARAGVRSESERARW